MVQSRTVCAIAFAALVPMFLPTTAHASCGTSFCSVNTQWESQGAWTGQGLRFGLRTEYIDQDQLRHGGDQVAPAGTAGTTDEIHTLNRNLTLTLDYAFHPDWALSAQLPYFDRSHRHVVNGGAPPLESWHIQEIGDLRLMLRRQFGLNEDTAAGAQFGVKLPTGSTTETNGLGIEAERSLQPGSGTTDVLLGGYYYRRLEGDATTLFAQLQWQMPLREHQGYAPGQQLALDVGLRYALTLNTSAQLQLNMLWKDHDRGINAEVDRTGGSNVYLSPGLSHLLTPKLQLYGFVQLPLYRYLNGTQLSADWAMLAGLSWML